MSDPGVVRRARPLLGTLVEIGVVTIHGAPQATVDAVDAAFARIAALQERLSRFVATSDIVRFNAAPVDVCIDVGDDARAVLLAAAELRDASDGAFDVTLGSGACAWRLDDHGLHKLGDGVHIDLGGIAKGHAVDCAVATLEERGVASGWVNAGGDLRAFGDLAVPIELRDETGGGVRRFATIEDGAFATSHREGPDGVARHASVAAPRCLWADALTKVVVATANASHPLLERLGARAWLHDSSVSA
ncbi:MAG TPA: FAD:protein FMN transferase [Caldimonas sp.]|nr:FAD:protein FMN transferase [Caldimonas sp.]